MATRPPRVTRERLHELLKKHGRDFIAIGKVLNIGERTVHAYVCEEGLTVTLPPMKRGPKPHSIADRGPAVIFRDGPWELDWTTAPIAKHYGVERTNYHTQSRLKPLKGSK